MEVLRLRMLEVEGDSDMLLLKEMATKSGKEYAFALIHKDQLGHLYVEAENLIEVGEDVILEIRTATL